MSTLLDTPPPAHHHHTHHDDDGSPVLSGWAGPDWSVPVQMAINALDWDRLSLPVVRSVLTAEISLMGGRGRHDETRETVATLAGVCYGTVGRVRALAAHHGVLVIDHRGNNGHHTRPKRVRLGPVITNATSNTRPPTATDAAVAPAPAPEPIEEPTTAVAVEVPHPDLTAAVVAPTGATAVAPTGATPNKRDNYLARGSSCETKGCTNPIHLNPRGEPNRLCKPCYWHQRTHPTAPTAQPAPRVQPPDPVIVTETEFSTLLDALDGPGTTLDDLQALNRAQTQPRASQRRTPQWGQIRRRLDPPT